MEVLTKSWIVIGILLLIFILLWIRRIAYRNRGNGGGKSD